MSNLSITFGPSGYRGVIGKTFTCTHVIAISQAIASFLHQNYKAPTVVIGYDPRIGNDPSLGDGSYTKAMIDTLLEASIPVWLCQDFTPTPVISWMVDFYKLHGGVVLTASHMTPNYNGVKFISSDGAPATGYIYDELGILSSHYYQKKQAYKSATKSGFQLVSKTSDFVTNMLRKTVQALNLYTIYSPKSFIYIDVNHGASAHVWNNLFMELGMKSYELLKSIPMEDFNGIDPNPSHPDTVDYIRQKQKKKMGSIAYITDPDGDRFQLIDETGVIISPEVFSVILMDYLVEKNIPIYGVVTTVSASSSLKIACKQHGVAYTEKQTGFHHVTSFLKQAKKNNMIGIAVDTASGFSWSAHTLEKCGFLPLILSIILMVEKRCSLATLYEKACKQYGYFYSKVMDWHYSQTLKKRMIEIIEDLKINNLQPFFEVQIDNILRIDGAKIMFSNGDWILIRLSGTEAVLRVCVESEDPERTSILLAQMEMFLNEL